MPVTDPTRRSHLFLENRAPPFSVVVPFISLYEILRYVHISWGNVRSFPEALCSRSYFGADLVVFRRVHRPAKGPTLLEEGVY